MKNAINKLILANIMGGAYFLIEVLYDGTSHWSMYLLGAFIGILIGQLNEYGIKWETPLWKQILLGEAIILPLEFLTGCVVNIWLGLNVWDYSDLPLSLLGQTSLTFAPMFIPCIVLAIIVDDYYRYKFMDGEKPRYKLF